jgi:curved DNA-binding protein CbpA
MCALRVDKPPQPPPRQPVEPVSCDHHGLLGVSRHASAKQIKRAYRKLAREHHPDLNPGDDLAAFRFRRIVEAKEALLHGG